MYFDRRLWAMMGGLRLRVAAAVGLGLIAMVVGILRFVCLGRILALTFAGAPLTEIATAAAAVTPHFSSSILASSEASKIVSFDSSSTIFDNSAMTSTSSFGSNLDGPHWPLLA